MSSKPFRERYGIRDNDITLVTISRLDKWLKADSLHRTVDVVRTLGRDLPRLRFVIVGDGDVRTELDRAANETNAELGRPAVVLTGALIDPRPAYAAADIVVGMGGSALRGMAFRKPVVIVGDRGFSAPFNSETAASFYYTGIHGVGDGSSSNARLMKTIRGLAEQPDQLRPLGEFSRQFIVKHFALDVVSASLAELYRTAVAIPPQFRVAAADGIRVVAEWARQRRFVPPAWRA